MIKITQNNVLVCPQCDEDYLHHRIVESIFRDSEDSNGTCTSHGLGRVHTTRIESNNIEGRRDVAHIDFWCEMCHTTSRLKILQHKGQTYVSWDEEGR